MAKFRKYDKAHRKKQTEDLEFKGYIDDICSRAMARTHAMSTLYRDAIRMCYGDQLPPKADRHDGWDYSVVNIICPGIWQEIAMLSANDPRLVATGIEDSDKEAAMVANSCLQGNWNTVNNMKIKVIQALQDGHLAGQYVGFWNWNPKNIWNAKTQKWQGEVEVNVVNPSYFGCDPDVELAADIPTKAGYVVLEYFVDKIWAANKWPEFKQFLIDKGQWEKDKKYQSVATSQVGNGQDPDYVGFDASIREGSSDPVDPGWDGSRNTQPFSHQQFGNKLAELIASTANVDGSANKDGTRETADGRRVKYQYILHRDYEEENIPAEMRDFTPEELKANEAFPLMWSDEAKSHVDGNKPLYDIDGENVIGYDVWDTEKEPHPQKEVNPSYTRPLYPNGRVTIRIAGECIVEDRPYPYSRWNLSVGVNTFLPHIWQGGNAVEQTSGLQRQVNLIHTHLIQNIKHHGSTQWVVEEGAVTTKDETDGKTYIPNEAGSVIGVAPGRLNDVKQAPPPPMPNWFFQMESLLRERSQDIQGLHDVTLGKGASGQQTLGETKMINGSDQLRSTLQAASLYIFLIQIGYGMLEMMQSHYEIDRWVRTAGEGRESQVGAVQWSQDLVNARMDIQIEPGSTAPNDEREEIARYGKATELIGPAMFRPMLKKLKIVDVDEILADHELLGPFTAIKEQAAEMGMGDEQIMMAFQQVLQQFTMAQAAMEQQQQGPGPAGPEPVNNQPKPPKEQESN